jgi:hypothetical protein
MLLWLPYQLEARCDDLSQRPDPPDRPRKRRGADGIAGDVLRPAVVTAVIDGFLEQLLPANVENRVDELRRALRKLDGKIANLTAAIEQGRASLPSIIGLLSERQKERDVLVAEIGSAETLHQIHVDRPAIEAKVQRAVGNWRGC